MRAHETYTLDCYACDATVKMPANADMRCPQCGASLDVQWREHPSATSVKEGSPSKCDRLHEARPELTNEHAA